MKLTDTELVISKLLRVGVDDGKKIESGVLTMAEYIERESFFKFLTGQMTRKQNGAFAKGFNKGIMVARAAVHNREIAPAADVVEVVRCRDCTHYYHGTCANDFALNLMRENDYCSYGERKCEK